MRAPITIRDLHRCEGCGRWIANIWAHLRCRPPLTDPLRHLMLASMQRSKQRPRRKIAHMELQGSVSVLSLECGHVQRRVKVPKMPVHVHCAECELDLRRGLTMTTTTEGVHP